MVVHHRAIVAPEMPCSTLTDHQRRANAFGQRLLQYRVVLIEARVDLAPIKRPRDVACLRHRKGDALEPSVVAGDGELLARRRDRRRTLEEDGGVRVDLGEAGHGGAALIDTGRVGCDGDCEVGRGANDLRARRSV